MDVVRKNIKNLHLNVYPPHGRVLVSVPKFLTIEAVRSVVVEKLNWIKRQRVKYAHPVPQVKLEMLKGERHYFLGQQYLLNVEEKSGERRVSLSDPLTLNLKVAPGTTSEKRLETLQGWYREQLHKVVSPMFEEWSALLNVKVKTWGIKRMKTRWGSCNPSMQRIWLNLELAKKPIHCIEYVVVHELAHLIEASHGPAFKKIMDQALPPWRSYRKELNGK